eukprot:gene197-biopygen232
MQTAKRVIRVAGLAALFSHVKEAARKKCTWKKQIRANVRWLQHGAGLADFNSSVAKMNAKHIRNDYPPKLAECAKYNDVCLRIYLAMAPRVAIWLQRFRTTARAVVCVEWSMRSPAPSTWSCNIKSLAGAHWLIDHIRAPRCGWHVGAAILGASVLGTWGGAPVPCEVFQHRPGLTALSCCCRSPAAQSKCFETRLGKMPNAIFFAQCIMFWVEQSLINFILEPEFQLPKNSCCRSNAPSVCKFAIVYSHSSCVSGRFVDDPRLQGFAFTQDCVGLSLARLGAMFRLSKLRGQPIPSAAQSIDRNAAHGTGLKVLGANFEGHVGDDFVHAPTTRASMSSPKKHMKAQTPFWQKQKETIRDVRRQNLDLIMMCSPEIAAAAALPLKSRKLRYFRTLLVNLKESLLQLRETGHIAWLVVLCFKERRQHLQTIQMATRIGCGWPSFVQHGRQLLVKRSNSGRPATPVQRGVLYGVVGGFRHNVRCRAGGMRLQCRTDLAATF